MDSEILPKVLRTLRQFLCWLATAMAGWAAAVALISLATSCVVLIRVRQFSAQIDLFRESFEESVRLLGEIHSEYLRILGGMGTLSSAMAGYLAVILVLGFFIRFPPVRRPAAGGESPDQPRASRYRDMGLALMLSAIGVVLSLTQLGIVGNLSDVSLSIGSVRTRAPSYSEVLLPAELMSAQGVFFTSWAFLFATSTAYAFLTGWLFFLFSGLARGWRAQEVADADHGP